MTGDLIEGIRVRCFRRGTSVGACAHLGPTIDAVADHYRILRGGQVKGLTV
jgi:hypothetical protein